MSRVIISQPTYRAQLTDVIESLGRRAVTLDQKHIIIVPDRITLSAEIALCEYLGGAFDVSVMTFNRLFTKYVPDKQEYLSTQGSVMVMKKLLAENPNLECFTKSSAKKGFSQLLYETVSMLIGCNVPPDAVGGVRGKGRDLRLMYEKYLGATNGRYTDAGGRLKLLKKYLETSDFLTNAHVYICCFDNLTPQMRDILDVIDRRALSLTEYVLAPERPSVGDIELYCAPGKVLIAKAAAARIAALVKTGEDCGQFCVVTSDGRADEIKRIFDENGIPYASPESEKLSQHPLGRLLSSALNARLKGYKPGDLIRLSKNVFSGVDKADSDCFERYVTKYKINYKLFFSPFTLIGQKTTEDETLLSGAERARVKLQEITGAAETEFYDAAMRLIAYARRHAPEEMTAADEGRANPFDKAEALCALTQTLIGGGDFRLAAEAFMDGMDAVELAVSPTMRGGVEIGDEGSFRCRRFKYVFVLDFDYDNHPRSIADTSLISDDDIAALRSRNIPIGPTAGEVNSRQTQEFLQLISGAERVFLGYSQKAGNYLGSLKSEADIRSITESTYDREAAELETAENTEALLKYCPTRAFMFEQYRIAQSAVESGFDPPRFMPYLEKAVGDGAEKFGMKENGAVGVLGEIAMPRGNTSVSRIETYAACPMKHFFQYGLKGRPVDTGELLPVDIGNILHNAAESYVKGGAKDPVGIEEAVLDESLARYREATGVEYDEKYRPMLLKETKLLLGEIYRHLSAGDYTPLAAEMEFLDKDVIDISGNKISFTGKIDRVDVCGNRCRVVDYKTGRAKFSLTEIYGGVKLQLMIYLGHMIKQGYEPGGAYYFPITSDWESDEITMDGITEDSDASVMAADRNALTAGASTVVNAKTSRGKFTLKNGYPISRINTLTDYAYSEAKQALTEISEGYISPSPCDVNICRYCDYRDCCGYEGAGRKLPKVKL